MAQGRPYLHRAVLPVDGRLWPTTGDDAVAVLVEYELIGPAPSTGDLAASLPPLQGRVEQNDTSLLAPLWRQQPQRVGRRRVYGATVFGPAIVAVPDPDRAGDLAVTLGPVVAAIDGTVPQPQGDVAVTLGLLAGSLDGTFVPAPIAGDLASTLPALTASMADLTATGYTFFVEC